jgi:hypothetical protein
MRTRKDKRDRIEAALEREGLRYTCDAIDRGHDGEVVLWAGVGHPVRSVREALEWAREQAEKIEIAERETD